MMNFILGFICGLVTLPLGISVILIVLFIRDPFWINNVGRNK